MKIKGTKVIGVGIVFLSSFAMVFSQTEGETLSVEKNEKSAPQLKREAAWEKGLSGDNLAAHQDLKAAIGSEKGSGRWHMQYGTLLTQLTTKQLENGQVDAAGITALEAKKSLETAVAKISDEDVKFKVAALTKLAYVQGHFFNDKQLAEKTLQRALVLDPENEGASQKLKRFSR
jgi:hypothetical protein